MAYQENKQYKNDGVLMGNVKSPTVRFNCGITADQAKDLLNYVTESGWINFDIEFTRNGKAIMKVIDPRLRQQNAAPAPAAASGDGLPF